MLMKINTEKLGFWQFKKKTMKNFENNVL